MTKQLNLELIVKARDYASRVVGKLSQNTATANQQMTQSAQRNAQAQQQAITQTARIGEQAARTGVLSARRVAQAREGLGIRSERQIQREINRTIAQYDRLKRSGTATSRELMRASEQVRNKIRTLNAEIGKTSTGQRLGNIVKGGAGVVAGAVTAKHVITPAMNDRKQWDANVTNVALQAFGDKDANYIQTEGINQIQQAVVNTVKNVGGTHDQALGNLNAMMVNGMSFEQAVAMLGQAQKMQVSGEANSEDIGSLIKVLSDYGLQGDALVTAFNHALRSGMDGKFEIKDMVQALPDLLATASNAGFKGIKDFDFILSWLQSAADKAGNNSVAATNVSNTLNKLTASDTTKRFADIENPYVKGKGIDLQQSLLDGKARGLNPVEVISDIADKLLAVDGKYQQLVQQRDKAKTDEDKQKIDAQLNLMKGFVLSKLLPDVQAKAGLNAATDKQAIAERQANLTQELTGNLNETRFEVLSGTDAAVQARKESLAFLGEGVSGQLNQWERKYNDWQINMAKDNPELFSAMSSASTAFQALAAGAGVAAVALWGIGGGKGGNFIDMFRKGTSASPVSTGSITTTKAATSMAGRAVNGRLGNVLSLGGKALAGLSILDLAMVLGERQPYQQAQEEQAQEKHEPQTKQFARAYTHENKSPTVMPFSYGNAEFASAMGVNSKGVPLYGGYALAALHHDDKVAQARYEMGGYSQLDYQQRLSRNAQQRETLTSPKTVSVDPIARFTTSLAEIIVKQGESQSLMGTVTTHFEQYHQDIQALATSLPYAIEKGFASQSHTIDNRIVVELDGRVLAEQTSQHLFNFANRG